MLINTKKSPYAKAYSIPWQDIEWIDGFWKDRVELCANVTIPHILSLFEDNNVFHVLENYRIAAGESEGEFKGTPYGDGDFYKLLEGISYIAYKMNNEKLQQQLDDYIALIGRAQQEDGYISTKQIIGEKYNTGVTRHSNIEDFEVYNIGHLLTSACQHKRLSGKDNFLQIAIKAAGYLEKMYTEAARTGSVQTAVCPSHYMGLVELYRTTGDERYLKVAELAMKLRDHVKNGTDDNQDRIPLEQHEKIVGHAVRSTYLYAGVTDLYLENGNEMYRNVLEKVWKTLTEKKIYITGGCGALYNGVSPYGLFPHDQKVHQAFGYEYQLPNVTAYNETCATLGNIFWNHRLFAADPQAIYFDIIERSMLNLALAAVSLDGDKFFYENMLRRAKKLDYPLMWPLTRSQYISCFCCPTNLSRCIMESAGYSYMVSDSAVYVGIYGASRANFNFADGTSATLVQQTDYPWDGTIIFTPERMTGNGFTLKIRVPGWVEGGYIEAGGKRRELTVDDANTYVDCEIRNVSDVVKVYFEMPVRYTVAHPLVEENNNQVAVERGPLVYCMETGDADVETLDDILLLSDVGYRTVPYSIKGTQVIALESEAVVLEKERNDRNALYQTLKVTGFRKVPIRLIPYFAWDNRGFGEMRIWMPIFYNFK